MHSSCVNIHRVTLYVIVTWTQVLRITQVGLVVNHLHVNIRVSKGKRYILQQKCLNSEQVNRKCPLGTWFCNFLLSAATLSPQTSHLLNRRCCYHLPNTLKTYCEQANLQNFHVWNSHRHQAAWLFQTMPYDRLILSNSWGWATSLIWWQCNTLVLSL